MDLAHSEVLGELFLNARTHRAWTATPVPESTLREIYETMKYGPTSANTNPFRVLFLTTQEAKERLLPSMAEGNREKTRTAPVVAIFAYDIEFYEHLDQLMPGRDMKSWFSSDLPKAERSAFQNSTLQAGYFILATRGFGLDCGPMTGFDADGVNATFFEGTTWRANIICNLGYGDATQLGPRLPRLDFEQACRIL